MEIAKEVGARGALMQNVTNFAGDFDGEMDLVRKQAEEARVLLVMEPGGQRVMATKLRQ